jgi:hypothetical protein
MHHFLTHILIFPAVRIVHFEMKLYSDQRNAQGFNFLYPFTSALHVSGFLLAHIQRKLYTCL